MALVVLVVHVVIIGSTHFGHLQISGGLQNIEYTIMAVAMDRSISETSSSSTDDGCSCETTACYFKKLCSCKKAGVSCTDHCSCGVKKPCKNNKHKTTAVARKRAIDRASKGLAAETSTTVSTTTHGGCRFEALINGGPDGKGERNYCCDPSCLLDLTKVATTNKSGKTLNKEAITDRRVKELVKHVDDKIFRALKIEGKKVKSFYIGKTFVITWEGRRFSNMNPNTWRKDGIKSRWLTTYKDKEGGGYDALIVISVVTRNLILRPRLQYQDQEEYALKLEQELIHYYKEVKRDPRIRNEGYTEGKKTEGNPHIGYPLYVALQFKK